MRQNDDDVIDVRRLKFDATECPQNAKRALVSSGISCRRRPYRVRGDAGQRDVPCEVSLVVLVKNRFGAVRVYNGGFWMEKLNCLAAVRYFKMDGAK